VLSVSLLLLPNSVAYSKTIFDVNQLSSGIELESNEIISYATDEYGEALKLAEKKAKVLTSIYGVTSIQYALSVNGEIVLSGQSGVYSKESDDQLTNRNMYGIGSISKVFTTTAVMQLVDQGKVDLDSPVIEYIPEFTMADSRYKEITVRMLLNHSSGLMGSSFASSMLFGDDDFSAYHNLLDTLKTQRLKANPGEFSVYCNDGFSLAELLVEKVSGLSFTEYMKKYITEPLKLNATKTALDSFDVEALSKTYKPGSKNSLPTDNLNMIGAGGMYSSAEDLCNYAQIFMNNSNTKILSKKSIDQMANPEYRNGLWAGEADSIFAYGLGWDSVKAYPFNDYGITALTKDGDTLLYHGSLIVLPYENMSMAVLTSGGASTYDQTFAQEILLAALKETGSIKEIKPYGTFDKPINETMPADLKQYEGLYAYYGSIMKIVIDEKGFLTQSDVYSPASGSRRYNYGGNGRFYSADGNEYISFVKERNGITYLYDGIYAKLPSLGQYALAGYQAQKLSDNPISDEVKSVWDKRNNKKYFMINEKYSSQLYLMNPLAVEISMLKDLEGYCLNAAIVDENTAQTTLQIPGMYGRDINDYHFYQQGKVEYLEYSGRIMISQDAILPLSTKNSFRCKIGGEGYAQWYRIDEKTASKTIKVSIPEHSSYAVYDDKNNCLNFSYVSKQSTVTLPKSGYIVFVGDAYTEFTIEYVKDAVKEKQ
jgi:CubicO group peptidase (beta-lactamase class C family)